MPSSSPKKVMTTMLRLGCWRRLANARATSITDTVPLPDDDPAGDSDTVAEAAERMELDACLQRLRCLPPCQAEVVALRVIGGLSVTETAAMIGKSEGAVRVLAHRGLHQLRKQLSAEARRRWEESSSAA